VRDGQPLMQGPAALSGARRHSVSGEKLDPRLKNWAGAGKGAI